VNSELINVKCVCGGGGGGAIPSSRQLERGDGR
jgi:hypothetical protein